MALLLVAVLILANFMVDASSEDRTYIVRQSNYGIIKGFVQTLHGEREVEKYLGIPYAEPPIGELRYENPVPPKRWGKKALHALQLPPACLQSTRGMKYIRYHIPMFNKSSEDCLYLNIYRPREERNEELLPVNIYVHGGSYQGGNGAMFDGSYLALEGIIVVNFNYRLGPLGFLTVPKYGITGNYGMLDQIAVFRWVNENIRHFGGDPNRVTIDGHSAGASCVGLHLVSPLSKGLFNRVIQQSGSPLAHWAVGNLADKPSFYDQLFLLHVQCANNATHNVKACLKSMDTEKLKKILLFELKWLSEMNPKFIPVIDGYFLPENPIKMLQTYPLNAHQFFTGITKNEGHNFANFLLTDMDFKEGSMKSLLDIMNCFCGYLPGIRGIVGSIFQQYLPWPYDTNNKSTATEIISEFVGDYFITAPSQLNINILQARNITVYFYYFSYLSELSHHDAIVHGAELFYLIGAPLSGHANFRFDYKDKMMSRYLIRLWATFIKQGLPSLISFKNFYIDRYTIEKPIYALITKSQRGDPLIELNSHFRPEKMAFWNKIVPELRRQDFYFMNYKETPYERHRPRDTIVPDPAWGLMTACILLSVLVLVLAMLYCRTRLLVKKLLRQSSGSSGTSMINNVN